MDAYKYRNLLAFGVVFFFATFFLNAQTNETYGFNVKKLFSDDEEQVPESKPYQLPTFNQLTAHYNDQLNQNFDTVH